LREGIDPSGRTLDALIGAREIRDHDDGRGTGVRDDARAFRHEQRLDQHRAAVLVRVLQGQRDLITVSKTVLSELAPLVDAQHGVFYIMDEPASGEARLKMLSSYAYKERKNISQEWKIGEGLVGQCAYEKQRIMLTNVASDYIEITSRLGEAKPLKYPDMFRAASLMLLNKCDLLPYLDFDAELAIDYAHRINPKLQVIRISATSGAGMAEWLEWIKDGCRNAVAAKIPSPAGGRGLG